MKVYTIERDIYVVLYSELFRDSMQDMQAGQY
jgi:hypothetical protein